MTCMVYIECSPWQKGTGFENKMTLRFKNFKCLGGASSNEGLKS